MNRLLFLVFVLLMMVPGFSQDLNPATWRHIDTSVAQKRELSAVYDLLQQLRKKAIDQKKYFDVARTYYYEILIADKRTEDSLYYRNSACIDSILFLPNQQPELELAMHILQARRLTVLGQKSFYNPNRYSRKDIPINYGFLTQRALDSISLLHFEKAKQIAKRLPDASADDMLWLAKDPLVFFFKPGPLDIAIAEQIYAVQNASYSFSPTIRQANALAWPSNKFIANLDSIGGDDKNLFALKYFKEWIGTHKDNPGIQYFIETLARKYLYEKLNRQGTWESYNQRMYEQYLAAALSYPSNAAKAHAVYQLCLLWNQQSKEYFPDQRYEYEDGEYRDQNTYDTTYQYHALKALRLFRQHASMLDSFSYLKDILEKMEKSILETGMSMSFDNYNLPGEPILAELTFKNAKKLFYTVVRLNWNSSFQYRTKEELMDILRKFPEVTSRTIDLPGADDHNKHATYLKLDGLPPGHYSLLFSHQPFSDDNRQIERINFEVTSMAVFEGSSRFYILDRKTGFPVAGATVMGVYEQDQKEKERLQPPVKKKYTTNEHGYVEIKDDKIEELEIYNGADTTSTRVTIEEEIEEPEDIYNKEEYGDLVEYYEDNAYVEIFTDRSIYRPGQTVHFKAIFITRNKDTGEPMLMSKETMKGGPLKKVYQKWLKESEPLIVLRDPFYKEVDSLEVKLNEYGSLAGSFKIPKTAATGEWVIEPDYMEAGRYNDGRFKVEEYKRPSYEVDIETPKKELLPGDSFTVKVKVKSFAGAALNNVRINYTVDRNAYLPAYDTILDRKENRFSSTNIIDTSSYTNTDGELEIVVSDVEAASYLSDNSSGIDFTYKIIAEAIDNTGESYDKERSFDISTMPVNITLTVDGTMDRYAKNNIRIAAKDENAGKVDKDISLKIYRLPDDGKLYNDRKLLAADKWLYNVVELQQWFPLANFNTGKEKFDTAVVFNTTINTGKDDKLDMDPARFPPGEYIVEATCVENGRTKGISKRSFSVYDQKENKLPGRTWFFYDTDANTFMPGETFTYRSGNSESGVYSLYYVKYYRGKKRSAYGFHYESIKQDKGIYNWKWKIPTDATDQALLTHVYVLNNQVFKHTERIYINNEETVEPEIIIEQYRKKLSPGGKETFSISIKTKNDNTAAELMTTLYDAALDKLQEHRWQKPVTQRNRNIYDASDTYLNYNTTSEVFARRWDYYETRVIEPGHAAPLWWINPIDYSYEEADVMTDWSRVIACPTFEPKRSSFQHDMNPDVRWSGMGLAGATGLSEVVVIGYGSTKANALMGSVSGIQIRGSATSLASYAQPLVLLDGVPYEGDLSKLDASTITHGLVLKGADASAIWGARAAQGVLILSTKGEIILPAALPDPPLPPRKNFSETAFFFPAIYADKNGYYTFSFTMPESVTEWNWKMMAHTKKLQFPYAERKLNTQLPLMVQPNMPRLLYQGDRIVLQSRISNLDSTDIAGKISCRIEDMVTGEDITAAWLGKTQNDFSVTKKSTIASGFELTVPKTQMNPVKVIVAARSQNFADGEEHILPVLSPRVLVRKSTGFQFEPQVLSHPPMILNPGAVPGGAELYGVGLSINPKPQSALINALPYLANYSFDCAEQTFNKLLAHVTALQLMRTDKEAQQSFTKAKENMEQLSATEQLPDELHEQTMPWLNLTNHTRKQQRQLFELLDTSRTQIQIEKHLSKLYKLQQADGGLSWFDRGRSNGYISCYVLAGFGKLQKDGLLIPGSSFDATYRTFSTKLLDWCDRYFSTGVTERRWVDDELTYIYARSFWREVYPLADSSIKSIRDSLSVRWKNASKYNLYRKALLTLCTLRYFGKDSDAFQQAMRQLNDIQQLAINDENGLRWKEIADDDDMSYAGEEVLALLAETFTEAGTYPGFATGISKWLLSAKTEDHWSSTKATSAVIQMLIKQNASATGTAQAISATFNHKNLTVTNDLLAGSSFSFVKENMVTPVELRKNAGPGAGHLIRYYFINGEQANDASKEISIQKELLLHNNTTDQWEPVTEKTRLKIGDKVRVSLTLETSKALQYVYIDDKRAAAFEPVDNQSGYQYSKRMIYYQSVRDAGMQFFAENIPSGKSVIIYDMKVAHEGIFTNGPASLQCMYKPEVAAYSNSSVVQAVK